MTFTALPFTITKIKQWRYEMTKFDAHLILFILLLSPFVIYLTATMFVSKSLDASALSQYELVLAREHNAKLTKELQALKLRIDVIESKMAVSDVLTKIKKNIPLLPKVEK